LRSAGSEFVRRRLQHSFANADLDLLHNSSIGWRRVRLASSRCDRAVPDGRRCRCESKGIESSATWVHAIALPIEILQEGRRA
jgi:hypothetical protein